MTDTLPRKITPALAAFCHSISPIEKPKIIPSRPAKDAVRGACFHNVAMKVERAHGSVAYGWAIWHTRGVMFEAEHHGVWRKRTGELVDVSPQLNGYDRIVFLADAAAVYDPRRYHPNILVAEIDDPNVLKFVDLARELREIFDPRRVHATLPSSGDFDRAKERLVNLAGMLPRPETSG